VVTPDARAAREGPVRLSDVARAAGVSIATASRVLHPGSRRPSEELRARVTRVAEELEYTPNVLAQAVARGRSPLVGLVVHDISDPYFSSIAAGVLRAASSSELTVTISVTGPDPHEEVRHVAALRRQRARAVIITGSRRHQDGCADALAREVEAFRREGGRVSMVSQQGLDVDTVVLDNCAGARELAVALHARGYRDFAALAGPRLLRTARDRLEGFRDGLAQCGVALDPRHVVEGDFTRDGGHAAARELLRGPVPLPEGTCVFAVNDLMAVGAMSALREAGVDLPRQVAVAGFDDISTLRDITPALSTVRVPLEHLGEQALALVSDPEPPAPRVLQVRGEVVLRDSTPPRAPA
jgi:LacI family transcriptional regulator